MADKKQVREAQGEPADLTVAVSAVDVDGADVPAPAPEGPSAKGALDASLPEIPADEDVGDDEAAGTGEDEADMTVAVAPLRAPSEAVSPHAPQAGSSAGGRHGAPKHVALAHGPSRKTLSVAAAAVVGALALVYVGGALVFSRLLFLPGTRINGQDVSLANVTRVAAEHRERLADYELVVEGEGLDFSLAASEIDLSIDGDAYVRQAQGQLDAWLWPSLAFQRRDLVVDTQATFDEAKVTRIVNAEVSRANEGSTPPVDASVELSAETGRYEVVGGVPGTEIDAALVGQVVSEALGGLAPSLAITSAQLALPEIGADDERLASEASTLNSYVDAVQTLTVEGNGVFAVGGAQIAPWLVVGEDHSVSIDGDAVTAWTRGDLSRALDSVGATRSYTRPDGKAIQVGGGTYGWSIDGATLAATMVANIQAGTPATVEIPMLQSAVAWNPGGADWGARYIDVDLSEQYVRLYDDAGALVWESPCVSGDVSKAHDTPTGVYSINGNMASGNVELRGLIDPKTNEPEYISYVTYWMPFLDNAIALHDASWRASFGGGIYQNNGSHGCVNLPSDAASRLYGMVRVGDVVVVHG